MPLRPSITATLVALAVACARPAPPSPDAAFAAPGGLHAALRDGDVELRWTWRASEDGGAWVEVATPGDDFVKLDAVSTDATAYVHPRVAPGTTFQYRLQSYFGRPSAAVEIATGTAANDDALAAEGPLDEVAAAATPPASAAHSLRRAIAEAAPAGLAAALSSPTSVDLRWTDRASDEDGYLVEVAAAGDDFRVAALLPRDATSFRKTELTPRSAWRFRVRAFFYGAPSSMARVSTPRG